MDGKVDPCGRAGDDEGHRRPQRPFLGSLPMKKTIYILAFVHLTVVAVTICHGVDGWLHRGWWMKPLAFYSSLNYAIWRYGFFSPDVGRSTEVEITVYGDRWEIHRYSTLKGFRFFTSSLESANRFYGFKVSTASEEAFNDLSARSVATRMLNVHPDASRIDYAMRSIRYPAMDEYLKGAPIRQVEFYNTTFVLGGTADRGGLPVAK
jgi:hypothetical protein